MKEKLIYFINNLGKKQYLIIGIFFIIVILSTTFFLTKNKTKIEEEIKIPVEENINTDIVLPVVVEETKKEEIKTIPMPVGTDRFTVFLKDTNESVAKNLFEQEYILDIDSFTKLLSGKDKKGIVLPGAYKISKEMNDAQLAQTLKKEAYMKWVVIPEGLRKEEIAKLLGDTLGWSKKQIDDWIKIDTTKKDEYIEGVYFPDTYLIPVDETPASVANRLIVKFNENFAPYINKFTTKNIKWTTALTLASIVQREASNNANAPLIAGILWNRLDEKMQLGVDATLQYMRGDVGNGWWAPISIADKKTESPYNTYINKGLPPHPISNPGISAIEAVLNPEQTDCLYYLHDRNQITHCGVTYEDHLLNIEKYLKNNPS